jgi:hypothetical protein
VTSWQDAWVGDEELDACLALAGRGELTARVVLSLQWDRDKDEDQLKKLIERRDRVQLDRLRARTVKIFQDGVVENYTAALLEPYLDDSGARTRNSGMSMIEPQVLNRYVSLLDAEGFQVHFHAIGDRAVREAVDAVEAAACQRSKGLATPRRAYPGDPSRRHPALRLSNSGRQRAAVLGMHGSADARPHDPLSGTGAIPASVSVRQPPPRRGNGCLRERLACLHSQPSSGDRSRGEPDPGRRPRCRTVSATGEDECAQRSRCLQRWGPLSSTTRRRRRAPSR